MVALTASGAIAQERTAPPPVNPSGATVHVGDHVADRTRIQPYNHAWYWRVVMPDGTERPQGIWSDHLDIMSVEGRRQLRRVQGMTYMNGLTTTGVNLIDPATCAPISTEQHRLNGVVLKRAFGDGRIVTTRTTPPAGPVTTTFAVPETPFDFLNGEDGPLLAALPLRVGYALTLFTAEDFPNDDGVRLVTMRVVREEMVDAGPLGRVRAFVVVNDIPGQYTQTLWISRDPPYYLRLVMTFPDNRYTFYFDNI